LEHVEHEPQRGCVSGNAESIPASQDQFEELDLVSSCWFRCLDERKADGRGLVLVRRCFELLPPGIERVFTELLISAKRANTLATGFLLRDSLAP
jgi:hypothetical protein